MSYVFFFEIAEKCAQYWPEALDGQLVFDHMEVTTADITESDEKDVVIRELHIKSNLLA